jgi:hypothetical protein
MCDQQKALQAMTAAHAAATQLRAFATPEAILGDEDNNIDEFLQAVSEAAKHFGAEAVSGLEADLTERGITDPTIVAELHARHLDEVSAAQLAAFALGVAWGRLETGNAR